MIESMLREMGFSVETVVNYDPHHVISNRRQANKNKPFEHFEVGGLSEVANWMGYPKDINNGENMQEASLSSALGDTSPQRELSSIVVATTHVTPLASFFEKLNKRDFLEAMDIDEEATSRTPKKKNIEKVGQLVPVTKAKGRNKHVKVKGPTFEI